MLIYSLAANPLALNHSLAQASFPRLGAMASDPVPSPAGAPRRIRVVLEDSVVRTIHDPRHYTGPGAPFDPPVAMR